MALACTGGCNLTMPMAPLASPKVEDTTGSIAPKFTSPLSPLLGAEDWRRAKGAMGIALDPQGSGASVAWDNPDSAIKGSFVPVGSPFVSNDDICRAFLATLTAEDQTTSLQGTACRPSGDEWSIKEVKPWRKPA